MEGFMEVTKKKFKVPHTYVIIFSLIIIVAILTYLIPAGQYQKMEAASGRTVVNPNSFSYVDGAPAKLFDVLQAFPKGLGAAQSIVFFIFIVGGSFNVINSTGAIEAGISKVAISLKGKEKLMIPIFVLVFSIGGGTIGMAEEAIVFVPIGIALARALGYDAVTGMAMVALGAAAGFTSAFMNPFTVGVAQGIAEEMEIRGRDIVSGLPIKITITSDEIREALIESINSIVNAIRRVLERTPPELSSDIYTNGIYLSGGGALLKGLDIFIEKDNRGPPA
jgi:uncharacterized ion transporter superfamily protein YfcC